MATNHCKIKQGGEFSSRIIILHQLNIVGINQLQARPVHALKQSGHSAVFAGLTAQGLLKAIMLTVFDRMGNRVVQYAKNSGRRVARITKLCAFVQHKGSLVPAVNEGIDQLGMVREMPVETAAANTQGIRQRQNPDCAQSPVNGRPKCSVQPIVTRQPNGCGGLRQPGRGFLARAGFGLRLGAGHGLNFTSRPFQNIDWKWLLACITLLLGLASQAFAATPPVARPTASSAVRPNIVVLVADDWGFTDLGAFGGEIATPHIDALALRGTRFTNFHAAASCSPTRSMLLTGVDNHLNGVGNLREAMPREHLGRPGYLGSLSKNVVTVATLLQDSGYRTYITGKWNVGSEPHNLPNRRGFDRSIIQGDTGSDNWVPTQRYLPHSAAVEWFEDGKPANMPAEFYSSTYFVDRMLGYLKADAATGKDKPFFAYLGFQANHVPIQAPPAFIDKYRGKYRDGWDALREQRLKSAAALGLIPSDTRMVRMQTTGDWSALSDKDKLYQQRQMEIYAAMAEAMDHEVGRFIDHLKATGEYDNTVFVFLSDNGAEGSDYRDAQPWLWTQYSQDINRLGGKGAYGIPGPSWASASVSPLSGYKFYAGEGGIRVPMLIAGVAGGLSNQIAQALTHVTDIPPTLLELASIPVPGTQYRGQTIEPITGKSLVALVKGDTRGVRSQDEPLGYELSGNKALFRGDLKLAKNDPPVGDGQWHLYDIRKDPGETQDLQGEMPAQFAAMQQDYLTYEKSHGVLPMPAGYSPSGAVLINGIFNYWLPAYGPAGLVLTVLLICIALLSKRKRSAHIS
jgi:arylsulfatase A-like enzyme